MKNILSNFTSSKSSRHFNSAGFFKMSLEFYSLSYEKVKKIKTLTSTYEFFRGLPMVNNTLLTCNLLCNLCFKISRPIFKDVFTFIALLRFHDYIASIQKRKMFHWLSHFPTNYTLYENNLSLFFIKAKNTAFKTKWRMKTQNMRLINWMLI